MILCILKPDAVERNLIGPILSILESHGRITYLQMRPLYASEARQLYKHHADKDYWPRIEQFMVRGPVVLAVVEGDDFEIESAARMIRKRFERNSENKAENIIHASELGQAITEIGLMCPDFRWPHQRELDGLETNSTV